MQVAAGGETALARAADDGEAQVCIRRMRAERVAELAQHGLGEGVALGRAVDEHVEDAVGDPGLDGGGGNGGSPRFAQGDSIGARPLPGRGGGARRGRDEALRAVITGGCHGRARRARDRASGRHAMALPSSRRGRLEISRRGPVRHAMIAVPQSPPAPDAVRICP